MTTRCPPKAASSLSASKRLSRACTSRNTRRGTLPLPVRFVTLAGDGSVRIERGFVRAEDEPKSKAKAEDQKKRSAKDAEGLRRFRKSWLPS